MRRNCSISPSQLGALYASLCVVSLGVAGFFWAHGATLVLPFAAAELLAVAVAFVVYARHAADGESVWLMPERLVVEQERGGQVQRREFSRDWVRIEAREGGSSLIEVREGGRSVQIGRHVRTDLRPLLAREMRQALRGA
ncbi:DUF2244 domain-containing protein [Hydrogenophaga sp.]|uniref:DUF2244 domain-containing protein n=1 Tax=Hydrogenophaga sp. TaxID=1904254 RepID=UPI0025BE6EFA|nr:DUF2244 domain-containing protein [Hydrogenophaga sp.]